jgi:hypothetical protein
MLTRGDDDDLKVKALEYVAPVGQQVYVKVGGLGRVHSRQAVSTVLTVQFP